MLIASLLCTLILTTVCMDRMTSVSANREVTPLRGITIAVDAGHGGRDVGAQCKGIDEATINLHIAQKTKALLENAGAHVIMTRNGNYDLADTSTKVRKKEDMKRRLDKMNQEDVDLFISIHLNSYPNVNVQGAQVFYQKDNEVAKTLATIVQKHLKVLTKTKMTSKPGDYYLLNHAKKIGVLVECGFLSNESDRTSLVQAEYQDKIAKTLYESIREYFSFLL